jgi:hypothetical protein
LLLLVVDADYNMEALERPFKKQKLANTSDKKPRGKWHHKHNKRRRRHEHEMLESGYAPSQSTVEKINVADASSVSMGLKLRDFKPKYGAYIAQNTPRAKNPAAVESMEKLVSECGFRVVEWDGW